MRSAACRWLHRLASAPADAKLTEDTGSGPFIFGKELWHTGDTILIDRNPASALLAGEIDYLRYVPFDWVARLKTNPNIRLMSLGGIDQFPGSFRLDVGPVHRADRLLHVPVGPGVIEFSDVLAGGEEVAQSFPFASASRSTFSTRAL